MRFPRAGDQLDNPLDGVIEPLKPTLVPSPPQGHGWLHEVKYDGYRMLAFLDNGRVKLQTKNGHDWSARFPELVEAVKLLPASSAVLDCEMCALLPSGVSSMTALKVAMGKASHQLVLFAFDLLYLNRSDLRNEALLERKRLLARMLKQAKTSRLQYVDHFQGDPEQLFSRCAHMGIEGLVSKRVESRYVSGKSDLWVKSKCTKEGRFIIGGLTRPKGSKIGVESLLVGQRQGGDLNFVGAVKNGISNALLHKWGKQLKQLERDDCPFTNLTPRSVPKRSVWLRPELQARVRYLEVTQGGHLRHASLLQIEG